MNILLVIVLIAASGALLLPAVTGNKSWRATVTPLASIIGSGFLVAAPILAHAVGDFAAFGIAALCAAGWLFGSAIRHNIANVEGVLENRKQVVFRRLDQASALVLAFAYWVSVAYYLNLFAAFALRGFGIMDQFWIDALTTAVLAGLAILGVIRGLKWLEHVEVAAVGLKLGVIAALIIGLAMSLVFGWGGAPPEVASHELPSTGDQVRILLGLVILVQGFETSRYLGSAYKADMRINTMRYAQIIATVIYVAFIGLATPWFAGPLPPVGGETAVIDLLRPMAFVVAPMLIIVALASQLSAAVADMNGSSGLVEDISGKRIQMRYDYAITAIAAIALTWGANIYQIIVYASKAFAAYYLLQCVTAVISALRADKPQYARAALFASGAVLAFAVILLGMPAESGEA
ncbi:hypothetical protein [Hyphobacterium sp.]|uniref:hypothetical protein n=1 Tax=Hyphobacterium sp. TaxID=2004662 RepID=UPI0037487DCA